MAYYSTKELEKLGFKNFGKNIKVSTKASIYYPEEIEIGDNSRIDDFCILSGKISIGKNVYIGPYSLIDAGDTSIVIEDFSTIAYRVTIFSRSDDYSGMTLTNSTIPLKYRTKTKKAKVVIKKHSIIGAGSMIFPGVIVEEGTSIGAMTLVMQSTQAWYIYIGIPARKLKKRKKAVLQQEKLYLSQQDER